MMITTRKVRRAINATADNSDTLNGAVETPRLRAEGARASMTTSPNTMEDEPVSSSVRATVKCRARSPAPAATNTSISASVGRHTHSLEAFNRPLANATRTAYSIMPARASHSRKAAGPVLGLSVCSVWLTTSRNLSTPGMGAILVTIEYKWKVSAALSLASHPQQSPVNIRDASHTLVAPRPPPIMHGTSKTEIVGRSSVAVARSS